MGRGPLNFRQRDVTALVKATENAGKKVSRVGLDKEGNILIYVGGSNMPVTKTKLSEWDKIDEYELDQARLHQKLR
jgi:hypothetical protein